MKLFSLGPAKSVMNEQKLLFTGSHPVEEMQQSKIMHTFTLLYYRIIKTNAQHP